MLYFLCSVVHIFWVHVFVTFCDVYVSSWHVYPTHNWIRDPDSTTPKQYNWALTISNFSVPLKITKANTKAYQVNAIFFFSPLKKYDFM